MAKLLLPAILVVLLTLAACTNPAQTAVVEPTPPATPTETAAADSQAERTPVARPTQEPTALPTQASPSPADPTATVVPTPDLPTRAGGYRQTDAHVSPYSGPGTKRNANTFTGAHSKGHADSGVPTDGDSNANTDVSATCIFVARTHHRSRGPVLGIRLQ